MKFSTVLLLFMLCVTTACNNAAKEKSRREAVNELKSVAEAINEKALEDVENGGLTVDQEFDYSGINDALDKAEKVSDGQEKIQIQLSKMFVAKFMEISEKLTNAGSDLAEGIDYSKAETEDDLSALSSKIRSYRKVNTEVKESMSMDMIKDLEREADRLGLKGKDRVKFFAEIKRKFTRQLPILHRIRDIDDELCAVILDQHEILKEHLGDWVWNKKIENIEFSNDEALDGFNEKAVRIEELAVEQADAQKEVLSLQ